LNKKRTISFFLIIIFLSSILAGTVYFMFIGEEELIAEGWIEVVDFPPIYSESPRDKTFAFIHEKTEQRYYLAYENQTLVRSTDIKYENLQGSNIILRGKLRYAEGIEDSQKYLILIVLEISKI